MCDKHSCDKNMLLVKCIEKFPCLYNFSSHEYSKKDITDKAWNEVANQTRLSVVECKEKWKNLRYGLLRSLKPHPDGSVKKKYYLHDEMAFVIPYIKVNSKHMGIIAAPLEGDTDEENNLNDHENEDSPIRRLYFELDCMNELNEPPNKRTRKSETSRQIQQTTGSSETNQENPRRMFLLSLLPEVEVLTEGQMRVFRRKVLELLSDVMDTSNQYDMRFLQLQTEHRHRSKNPLSEVIKSEPLD